VSGSRARPTSAGGRADHRPGQARRRSPGLPASTTTGGSARSGGTRPTRRRIKAETFADAFGLGEPSTSRPIGGSRSASGSSLAERIEPTARRSRSEGTTMAPSESNWEIRLGSSTPAPRPRARLPAALRLRFRPVAAQPSHKPHSSARLNAV
jgi:hypothetical protein